MKSVLREHRQYALKPFIVEAEEEPLGGWLIIRPDGIRFHLTDEDFKRHYDPIEEGKEMQATNEAVDYAELMGTIVGQEQKIKLYERALTIIRDGLNVADDMSAMAQTILEGDTSLITAYEEQRQKESL